MKKFVFVSSLFLAACNSGDDSQADSKDSCAIDDSSVLEGQVSEVLNANLESSLDGKVSIEGSTGFKAVESVQGKFGEFSMAENGNWSYRITNWASTITSPYESFSVEDCTNNQHEIVIKVTGMFQRISRAYEHSFSSDEPVVESGITLYAAPIDISSFYDVSYIQQVMQDSIVSTEYTYMDTGNISNIRHSNYELGGLLAHQEDVFDYDYMEQGIAKVYKDTLQYSVTYDGQIVRVTRKTEREYHIEANKFSAQDVAVYYYDAEDEVGQLRYKYHYDYVYDEQANLSELYFQYQDTDFRDVDAQFESPQLSYTYRVLQNGHLDESQRYRTSPTQQYSGVRNLTQYQYDQEGRVSYVKRLYASYDEIDEGVFLYDEPTEESAFFTVFNHIDELDVVVSINIYKSHLQALGEVATGATIFVYEDTDDCGDYEPVLQGTSYIALPRCRVKKSPSSSQPLNWMSL